MSKHRRTSKGVSPTEKDKIARDIIAGVISQKDVEKKYGVSSYSVKSWIKLYTDANTLFNLASNDNLEELAKENELLSKQIDFKDNYISFLEKELKGQLSKT